MGLRINTNVSSLQAQRNLSSTRGRLDANLRKLSSGERVQKAGDDAAGLAISEKLKSQIRSGRQAKRNAGDAISLIQTAEGGLSEISNIVIRLRELAMQASTDTLGEQDRAFSDIEFQNLKDEIERISQSSEFNGINLLNGKGGILDLQIGLNNDPALDRIRYNGVDNNATLAALGLVAESVATKETARGSLKVLDNALVDINRMRADMGATQNRLTSIVNTLGITDENLSAANSRIRDVDVASETADMTKNNILLQSGISVLSQANQNPNMALKLLG